MTIEEKVKIAHAAIIKDFESENEFGTRLFLEHHLEELDSTELEEITGSDNPTIEELLKTIVWIDNESEEMIDFSLPNDMTNYVICVHMDEDGNVEEVSMES